jgi:purine nucleosidase
MWDLALVEAYLNPDMSIIKEVLTPPENTQRIIKVYTKIDNESLQKIFGIP